MTSNMDARTIITEIATNYGLSAEDWERQGPDLFQNVNNSSVARLASRLIDMIAKDIYSKTARFILELLQNAEDCKYNLIAGTEEIPHVSFQYRPHCIIVECNEDGFTERDIRAVCDVAESSKTSSYGCIGAKGIGFKSVFGVASKVHIRSRFFSFFFRHERSDPGLSMIIPIWDNTKDILPSSLTRTTLYLHEDENADDLKQALLEIDSACLLFLHKLKQIRLECCDHQGKAEFYKCYVRRDFDTHRRQLNTITRLAQGREIETQQYFHVEQDVARNLPERKDREPPDHGQASASSAMNANEASSTAPIVLAFPLTSDSDDAEPVIKQHNIYAFLPVMPSKFKFLINSDFEPTLNREGIHESYERNQQIRDAIDGVFIKAIARFCKSPSLCFTWPRFLPDPDDTSDRFWRRLNDGIKNRIRSEKLFLSRHSTVLRKITEVYMPGQYALHGDPLFDNPQSDLFLSERYSLDCVSALAKYGLRFCSIEQMFNLLQIDLGLTESRMKADGTSEEWHSIVAQILSDNYSNGKIPLLRQTKLIPLTNGTWIAASDGEVFMLKPDDIPVPSHLGMRIIDQKAVDNLHRKRLFYKLGIKDAAVEDVRGRILARYRPGADHIELPESIQDLHYLYLTHKPESMGKDPRNVFVKLHSNSGSFEDPRQKDFYLISDNHAYGPRNLLGSIDDRPDLHVLFLNKSYEDNLPVSNDSDRVPWKKWLYDFLGVRRRLRLVSRAASSRGPRNVLSPMWYHLLENRPQSLLGFLEYLWRYEGDIINRNQSLKRMIKETPADDLCSSQIRFAYRLQLQNAFLPTEQLQSACLRFGVHEPFPFLKMESENSPADFENSCRLLHSEFGVLKDYDTAFLLEVLEWIRFANEDATLLERDQRIMALYQEIEGRCSNVDTVQLERAKVKNFFKGGSALIFLPEQNEIPAEWVDLEDCVWQGPPNMQSKHCLKQRYGSFTFDTQQMEKSEQMERLDSFFHLRTLQIPNATWECLVNELKVLKESDCSDKHCLRSLYAYMSTLGCTADQRNGFADERLIFARGRTESNWHRPADCLWSSRTDVGGRVVIEHLYNDLKEFFTGTLGVQELTLGMLYEDLLQTSPQADVDETKGKILHFNDLLETEEPRPDSRRLARQRVFPIKLCNGRRALTSGDPHPPDPHVPFVINDKEQLATQFEGEAVMLDFSMAEVRRLKPFFEWTGYTGRYISTCVKEYTSVPDEAERLIPDIDRDLKHRAHALLRIAATFNSTRYLNDKEDLCRTLLTAKTIETNEINCILRIEQDAMNAQVRKKTARFHIENASSDLKVYVPADKDEQHKCFGGPLPTSLARWLMKEEKIESNILNAVFTALNINMSAVDHSLGHQGIVTFPHEGFAPPEDIGLELERYDDSRNEHQDTLSALSTRVMTPIPSTSGGSTPSFITRTTLSTRERYVATNTASVFSFDAQHKLPYRPHVPLLVQRPEMPVTSTQAEQSDTNVPYIACLTRVIEAARSASFPYFEKSNERVTAAKPTNEDENAGFDGDAAGERFRSASQHERDKKVGAAGELYAFELLSHLMPSLPGWGRHNWQSRMRRHVKHHPNYADMEPFNEKETADLVYDDVKSTLTAMLIRLKHLPSNPWLFATPRYYIEVKTTTASCSTPFYMSRGQYDLMKKIHDATDRKEVYMILRVFDVEGPGIGMRVYLDPEKVKLEGGLVFRETWTVTPGNKARS